MCREVAWVELARHWDAKHDQDGVVLFGAIGHGWWAFAWSQRKFGDVGVCGGADRAVKFGGVSG